MPHIGLRPFSKLTLAVSFSVKLHFLWPAPALDLQDIVQEPETAASECRLTLDPHPPGREREVHLPEIEDAALFIIGDAEPIEMGVLIVISVPLAQNHELGNAPAHEGYAQTDLVGGHRALQITSLSRGGDRGAAPPAQCAAQKIDEAARL